ncbi:MAG: mevalonate kinase, partial [archaeon]|nr:mevalonate kinase [archaeon]
LGKDPQKRLDQVLRIILARTGIKENNFRLKLSTNMSLMGGMGSSAALAVSILRCLDKQYSLGLSNEKMNTIAFEVEKVFHQNPSGIDNTVSTYGGMIRFTKKEGENKVEPIELANPIEVVLVDTGTIEDTGRAVEFVRTQKEKDPKKFSDIFEQYSALEKEAEKNIRQANWKEAGKLMDKNQKLLEQMNLSSTQLGEIIFAAKNAGALGAKLTGTGRGGNAIALTPGKALQERVAKACSDIGYKTHKISLGIKVKK